MALITDIATARQYVKVNFTNGESSLADMSAADARFLVPVLGQTLYNTLLSSLTNPTYATLIDLCRKAVAPLAYWMDLPNMQTQITDRGVGTFTSNNMDSAHRWEFEQLRESLAEKGCWALEQLLQHLYDNATTYTWTPADEYKLIFLTGKEFYKYFPVFQPYRTFETLRQQVRQVEDNYVRVLIGDDFFEELRDKANPSAAEKKAIAAMKKAVANLTIKKALEVLPIKISEYGLTVMLSRNPDRTMQGEENAPTPQLSLMYKSVERDGETYLLKLKNYLDATASVSVFTNYFNSDFYSAPTTVKTDRNSTRVGIVGL
jgi:hypothetical protein